MEERIPKRENAADRRKEREERDEKKYAVIDEEKAKWMKDMRLWRMVEKKTKYLTA
jgi:hypothetical protein